jgi:hypothetical protein
LVYGSEERGVLDEQITIEPATPADAPLLAHLLEFYVHDLSDVFAIEPGLDGRFGYPKLPLYWSEPEKRFPFLIRTGGRTVGFVFVTRGSPATDDPDVLDIAEFFVLRRHRRAGHLCGGYGPQLSSWRRQRRDARRVGAHRERLCRPGRVARRGHARWRRIGAAAVARTACGPGSANFLPTKATMESIMSASHRRGAINRALLAALAIAAIAGVVILVRAWMQPPTQPDLDVGRQVVEEFLALVHDGRAGEAWDATTAEFKSLEGRESFMRTAAKAPILKQPLQFNSAQQATVQNQPRTEYLFQSPDAKMVRVLIGYEGGAWKVDRLTL